MNIISTNTPINNTFINKNEQDSRNDSNPLNLQKNFLGLLVAQIKNQDPTNPIKNTELTTQLAQINTASGIQELNNTLGGFTNQIHKHQNVQVSSLIGHHVMIPNTQIVHTKNNPTQFGIDLISNATIVEIKITDNNNKIVHLKTVKNLKPGIHHFTWNGKDLNEKDLETGKYNIVVTAKNKDQNVPIQSLSEALVNSIIASSNDPIIDLGASGNTTLSEIREILK